MPAAELAALLREMGDMPVTTADSIEEGCRLALEKAGRGGVVCTIGSLYLVGDATRTMRRLLGLPENS